MPMDIYDTSVKHYHHKFSINSNDNIDTTINTWLVEIYPNLDIAESTEAQYLKKELSALILKLRNALKIFDYRTVASISGKIANRVNNQYEWYLIEVLR